MVHLPPASLALLLCLPIARTPAQESVPSPPGSRPSSRRPPTEKKREGGFLGIRFAERRHASGTVLEIESVLAGSCAESMGFRKADLISAVDGKRIENGDHFLRLLWTAAMEARDPKPKSSVTVLRDGREVAIRGGLAELDAKPAVGEPAPDFTLAGSDGITVRTLSRMIGRKPVVLVFGSFTWPPFRRQSGTVEELYRKHGGDAEFLFVYIREAHPADSNWADEQVRIEDPATTGERNAAAAACCAKLELSVPTVVDQIDDRVNQKYCAWPERIYVIGLDGKVAYKSGIGPFGFKPDAAREALVRLLEAGK